MQNPSSTLVVLATGGTIAGRSASAQDNVGYQSAQLGVDDLLHGVAERLPLSIEGEQVAQIDSKDMGPAVWQLLVHRVAQHLARPEVRGVVITHGTDTLEEAAWLLHRVLAPGKPVVLTAAMRPATSLQSDGPQNLADALALAATEGASGVLAVLAGQVHGAADLRKLHSYRLDAFGSGDAGVIGSMAQGRLRRWRDWPQGPALGAARVAADPARWPWVDIVTSHGGARAATVLALVAAGVQGLVVAGTGNATLHHELAAGLEQAGAQGVAIRLVTRCAGGPVTVGPAHRWPVYEALSAPQARVELMLELLAAGH